MSFRLVPKLVTLNDLEWRNGRYIALISLNLVNLLSNTYRVDLWRNFGTSLYCIL